MSFLGSRRVNGRRKIVRLAGPGQGRFIPRGTLLEEMNEGQVNYSTERTISSQNWVSADVESAGMLTEGDSLWRGWDHETKRLWNGIGLRDEKGYSNG